MIGRIASVAFRRIATVAIGNVAIAAFDGKTGLAEGMQSRTH